MWRQLPYKRLRFQPLVSVFWGCAYSGGKKSQQRGRICLTSAWSEREYITGICRFLSLMFQFRIAVHQTFFSFFHVNIRRTLLSGQNRPSGVGGIKGCKLKTWYFQRTRTWMMAATRNILASSQIKRLLPCNVFIPLRRNSLMPVIQSSFRKGRLQHML